MGINPCLSLWLDRSMGPSFKLTPTQTQEQLASGQLHVYMIYGPDTYVYGAYICIYIYMYIYIVYSIYMYIYIYVYIYMCVWVVSAYTFYNGRQEFLTRPTHPFLRSKKKKNFRTAVKT